MHKFAATLRSKPKHHSNTCKRHYGRNRGDTEPDRNVAELHHPVSYLDVSDRLKVSRKCALKVHPECFIYAADVVQCCERGRIVVALGALFC